MVSPIWLAVSGAAFALDNVPVFLPNAGNSTGVDRGLRDNVPANQQQDRHERAPFEHLSARV
jgi:hypothetical protein